MSKTLPKAENTSKKVPLGKLKADADWYEDQDDLQEVVDARLSSLQSLLVTEDRIRKAKTENELQHLITNETRKFSGARQIFLFRKKSRGNFNVVCVSSMAITERDTPLIRWAEQIVDNLPRDEGDPSAIDFELPGYANSDAEETKCYPFRYMCWQPLKLADGTVFAGLMLARNSPWTASSIDTINREAEFYSHAWAALKRPDRLRPKPAGSREIKLALLFTSLLLLCAPISLRTLAPVEIIAQDPFVVAAPIDGVIDKILIKPNQTISVDQPLIQFDDTKLRNQLELSERDMRVSEAAYRRAARAAFFSEDARHQLAITKAEFELKKSQYKYAAKEFDRTVLRASKSGLAIFASKDDWKGRPVITGEQIMYIANPKKVVVRIDLPVADAIAIKKGAPIRLFLDADPLAAVTATVSETSYHARPTAGNALAYKLRATLDAGKNGVPRIGARGTAQIYGDKVPLAYYLFRRPLSWLRQNLGL